MSDAHETLADLLGRRESSERLPGSAEATDDDGEWNSLVGYLRNRRCWRVHDLVGGVEHELIDHGDEARCLAALWRTERALGVNPALDAWIIGPVLKMVAEFEESVKKYP